MPWGPCYFPRRRCPDWSCSARQIGDWLARHWPASRVWPQIFLLGRRSGTVWRGAGHAIIGRVGVDAPSRHAETRPGPGSRHLQLKWLPPLFPPLPHAMLPWIRKVAGKERRVTEPFFPSSATVPFSPSPLPMNQDSVTKKFPGQTTRSGGSPWSASQQSVPKLGTDYL